MVPAALVPTTPVFLMATAGLRMVGEAAKDAILQSVCSELSASGFLFRCAWATLLDGREEGLFGWVTVNYLLDALYKPEPPASPEEPVGIIDLGGGSVQIVFPTTAAPTSALAEYSQQLDFGGRKHSLYIKSHLGYGLDAARNAVLDLLVSRHEGKGIKHPCLPSGATLEYKGHSLVGEGDWHHCKRLQRQIFDTSACAHASCSFGGAYQPALPKTLYGFSYLYDRTAAIGLLDGKLQTFGSQQMSIADIERAGAKLCALEPAAVDARFKAHQDASKARNFCGDVAYLSTLLTLFGFPETHTLTMTNKIKDVELVWTLGAMLAKSAELASADGGGFLSLRTSLMLVAAALGLFYVSRRSAVGKGYRHVSQPLNQGHDSD